MSQPWFHGRIGREEAQDLIKSNGAVDGLFLLRESLSIAGTFVLTLAHNLKIRHFRISTVRDVERVVDRESRGGVAWEGGREERERK